ncbi:LysM peptidoglycan-binding domain-containing protein [Staphylococcus massiliensis]|uniref:Endopeptidase LytF n=2 Tax=Staphylococcus massiliensis TaxID=555791 RepID=K9AEE0_9STAP|nr:LysM peptidoglycan-binding domain-containing protein [Staphylococcus massiliensis]EKU45699.1 endopeptidase LytF [Staphylococcus massiliensis S46]
MKQKVLTSLFTTSIIAGVAAVSESEAATSYKVKAGDTLWGIAQSYHTSVAKLKEMNGLTGDTIYVNQYLSVPSIHSKDNGHVYKNSHAPNVYTVKAGDTLFDIGRRFNMNYHDIMRNNHLSSSLIHPGQQLSLTTTS